MFWNLIWGKRGRLQLVLLMAYSWLSGGSGRAGDQIVIDLQGKYDFSV